MNVSRHSTAVSEPDAAAVGPADRLLAEAVRALEQDGAAPCDEKAAEETAREQGGDLDDR